MRALPGYYYDEERKRYFPESSRPKNPPESKPILAEPSRLKSHPSTYQRWLGRVARDHKNIHAKIIQRQRISTRLDMDRVTWYDCSFLAIQPACTLMQFTLFRTNLILLFTNNCSRTEHESFSIHCFAGRYKHLILELFN